MDAARSRQASWRAPLVAILVVVVTAGTAALLTRGLLAINLMRIFMTGPVVEQPR